MAFHDDIANIAALCGDKARANILIALMNGKALTAGELAKIATLSAQATSNHLKKLTEFHLVIVEQVGRHRYYKLASNEVAAMLESISLLIPQNKCSYAPHKNTDKELCYARTCYNHLAGQVGVTLAEVLCDKNFITYTHDKLYKLTEEGRGFLTCVGLIPSDLHIMRGYEGKACLDYTERKYHLAGQLGKHFLDFFLEQRLIIRSKRKSRVVILTEKGKKWFFDHLNIRV